MIKMKNGIEISNDSFNCGRPFDRRGLIYWKSLDVGSIQLIAVLTFQI